MFCVTQAGKLSLSAFSFRDALTPILIRDYNKDHILSVHIWR